MTITYPLATIVSIKQFDLVYPTCVSCQSKIPFDQTYDDFYSTKCSKCKTAQVKWNYKLDITFYVYATSKEKSNQSKKEDNSIEERKFNFIKTLVCFDEVGQDLVGISANDFCVLLGIRDDLVCLLEEKLVGLDCVVKVREGKDIIDAILFPFGYEPLFKPDAI